MRSVHQDLVGAVRVLPQPFHLLCEPCGACEGVACSEKWRCFRCYYGFTASGSACPLEKEGSKLSVGTTALFSRWQATVHAEEARGPSPSCTLWPQTRAARRCRLCRVLGCPHLLQDEECAATVTIILKTPELDKTSGHGVVLSQAQGWEVGCPDTGLRSGVLLCPASPTLPAEPGVWDEGLPSLCPLCPVPAFPHCIFPVLVAAATRPVWMVAPVAAPALS